MANLPIHPLTERGLKLETDLNAARPDFASETELIAAFDDQLTAHTIFTTEHGVSYRKKPLQVGSVIIGLVRNNPAVASQGAGPTRVVLFEGYNNSPYKGAPKDCAEQRALRMGDTRVSELFAAGELTFFEEPLLAWRALRVKVAASGDPADYKGVNNMYTPTLHPCATPCRGLLVAHPAVSPQTPFDTYAVDLSRHSVQAKETNTLADFLHLYADVEVPDPTLVAQRRQHS